MELLHLRAAEKTDLAMNPLALGVSDKNAPGLRTKHSCGGLFCFVALLQIVELIIESLGSSTPAFRHRVVQPKRLWESVQAETMLQQREVRET